MRTIRIYYTVGVTLYSVNVIINDNDYIIKSVMGIDEMYVSFSLPEYIEFPTDKTYIYYEGNRYYLFEPAQVKKYNSENFEYNLKLEGEAAKLKRWILRNTFDDRIKFAVTDKPINILNMIVANCNLREQGWNVGTCIDSIEKQVSFNSNKIIDALQLIADTFETEWYIIGKTIHIGKERYGYSRPKDLSYGSGYGVKPVIDRKNSGDKQIQRLYVQGGDRNINSSMPPDGYGNKFLLLPKGQTIFYNGIDFSINPGIGNAREYQVSNDGLSISRSVSVATDVSEDSIDLSNIYPKRECEVTGVTIEPNPSDSRNPYYNINDSTIPEALNYNDYMLAGEKMYITFQSGKLTGRTFDISSYIHGSRTFKLVSINEDGQIMPNMTFAPEIGDVFIVFGCTLPDAYIRDDNTKTGASWDMFREAVKILWEREEMQVQFTLPIDEIWYRNSISRISKGDYINFIDDDIAVGGLKIRVITLKQYLYNENKIELTLSNIRATKGIKGRLSYLDSIDVNIGAVAETNNSLIGRTNSQIRLIEGDVSKLDSDLAVTTLSLNATKSEVVNVKKNVDVTYKAIYSNVDFEEIEGYKLNIDGNLVEDFDFSVTKVIEVTPNSYIIVSCYLNEDSSVVGYFDYDFEEEEKNAPHILLTGQEIQEYIDHSLTIPVEIRYVRVCSMREIIPIEIKNNTLIEELNTTRELVEEVSNKSVKSSEIKSIVITNSLPINQEDGVLYGIYI
ncbi:MAG: hypothetical protein ACK5MH_09085 [Bacteroidales bacterium]